MKKLVISLIFCFLCTSAVCFADVFGTTANTVITASGISFNYQDGMGLMVSVNGVPNAQITVAHIAGIQQTVLPSDQNSLAGGAVTYIFRYENMGNYADSLLLAKGDVVKAGTAGGTWTADAWSPSDPELPNAGDIAVQFQVTTPVNARNASTGTVTVNVRSAGAVNNGWTTGAYTGFNGNSYGGVLAADDQVVTTIVGPTVTVSARTVAVTQPAGYAGSSSDPVPGARLVYTVTVQNTGAGAANGLKIIEHINGPVDYLLGTMSNDKGGTLEYVVGTTRIADGGTGVTPDVSSLEWTFDLAAGDTAVLSYGVGIR